MIYPCHQQVCLLYSLAPDHIRQTQILDRAVMLQALDLNNDSLIKSYALVQTGLINSFGIDFVKVVIYLLVSMCVYRVFLIGSLGFLKEVLAIIEFLNTSLM